MLSNRYALTSVGSEIWEKLLTVLVKSQLWYGGKWETHRRYRDVQATVHILQIFVNGYFFCCLWYNLINVILTSSDRQWAASGNRKMTCDSKLGGADHNRQRQLPLSKRLSIS